MNLVNLKNCLLFWFGDKLIVFIFEITILVFLVFALIRNEIYRIEREKGVASKVIRGEISWGYLTAAFGILSLLSYKILALSEFYKGYKVIITLFNEISFLYLCYKNNWFRHKIISLFSKLKTEELKKAGEK